MTCCTDTRSRSSSMCGTSPARAVVPHFNKAALHDALATAGIRYEHLVELGGRRPVRPESHNLLWRNASFRGYADYMETEPFRDGVDRLLEIARAGRTAIMCSEAVWWRCHRSMIADHLKAMGVTGPPHPEPNQSPGASVHVGGPAGGWATLVRKCVSCCPSRSTGDPTDDTQLQSRRPR